MDFQEIDRQLQTFLKLRTSPLGVRFVRSREEAGKGIRFPKKDMGVEIMVCQAFAMARTYGWTVGLTKDDIKCGTGLVVLGFAQAPLEYYEGKFRLTPQNQPPEVRSVRLRAMDRLPYGEYQCMVICPISKLSTAPDLVIVYGNAAQILRLIQASLFQKGGYMIIKSAGVASCAEVLAAPLLHDQCQVAFPGNGERIFGHVGDEELAFAIPRSKIHEIIKGLELSHAGGQRYPIPYYVRYEPEIPEGYTELTATLKGE
jgi:uncharacterized protein (DUF169 family)